MAGRAGRRGFDTTGAVVLVQTAYEGPDTASTLALGTPEPLESQFSVSYAMVANLLRARSVAQARTLVESSFGNYTASVYKEGLVQELASLNVRALHRSGLGRACHPPPPAPREAPVPHAPPAC